MPKKVIILEDYNGRVEWFKTFFYDCEVAHFADVEPFIAALTADSYDLVILDHDLGRPLEDSTRKIKVFNYDKDGLTGASAARMIAEDQLLTPETPVLIWSSNPAGAENIASWLRQGGSKTIVIAPFHTTPLHQLAKLLTVNE